MFIDVFGTIAPSLPLFATPEQVLQQQVTPSTMVKISLFLGFVSCAVAANAVLVEAIGAGSALNDTSASVDTVVGDGSYTSSSVVTTVAPALNDTSASVDADVTITGPVATTAAPAVVDDGSASTGTETPATELSTELPGTETPTTSSTNVPSTEAPTSDATAAPDATTDAPVVTNEPSTTASEPAGSGNASSSTQTPTTTSDASTAANDASTSVADDGSTQNDASVGTNAPTATVANPANVTSTAHTTTPAPTVKEGPTPISGQVTLVPGYGDCGGFGFDYSVYMPKDPALSEYTMLTCEQGYRCQAVHNSDTFSCNEWPSHDPVPFYGQCGGSNYDGQTFCAPGAVCKYISANFSQCLPTY